MTALTGQQLPLALTLRQDSSFDTFMAGPNGAVVEALKQACLEADSQVYLWSQAGMGRSHLLEAAVRQVLQQGDRALLLAATELSVLSPDVLEGLEQFRLLAIDDIDLLAGQPHWEEALFHLYNRLRDQHGGFLCSARTLPAEAGFQLPDLVSRLSSAPVFRLYNPDDQQLLVMLQQRAAARGLAMADDVARFIIHRCGRLPVDVIDCLERLDHAALAWQRRLTVPFIKQTQGW